MDVCRATKANGEPCTLPAVGSHGFCWAHAPENAEKRRRAASRAARAKGNREVALLKEELKSLKDDVLAGTVDRNDAAVVVRIYAVIKDFVELERRMKETDQLAAEIEELKREYGIAG
jgi:hypothetical protein